MTAPAQATRVLDRDFLTIRAQILTIAASLDRLDRAVERDRLESDERVSKLQGALRVLLETDAGRAERIQMIFSDPYLEGWIDALEVRRG